jgi:16S rRNA (uracil1498-N3)-methyltransferase
VVEPLFISPIPSDTKTGSKIRIAGAEAKHAMSVRRLQVGEAIAVSDGQGNKARGKVSQLSKDFLELEVESLLKIERPTPKLVLVQALAKGDRDEMAVQACTELGIQTVIPWQSERSVSIWKPEKQDKHRVRWQTIATEAAKQSLRPFIPEVEQVLGTRELAERLKQFDLTLVLDPTSTTALTGISVAGHQSIAIVVGPEGGISPEELEVFRSAGLSLVGLGSGILRTSTAGVAVVSYLQATLGNWS